MAEIRIHKGYMHTKHGDDNAYLLDDPVSPVYTRNGVILRLMEELCFTPNFYDEDENMQNGLFENETDADFEYVGYQDVQIPESIMQRAIRFTEVRLNG